MALPAFLCLQVDPSARPEAHPAPPGRRCDLIEARHVGLIAVLSATPAGAHLSWPPSTTRGVMTSPPATGRMLTIGVDSHKDAHVAAAVDQLGRILATTSIPTTPQGFVQLERWASGLGQIDRFGIEGTGSFAAGLTRWLQERGYQVIEVTRPNRQVRRRRGKSDPVDAEAAARAVLAGEATVAAKTTDGAVEMLRVLRVARRSAVKAHTQAANQLASLVITAPEPLRQQLRPLGPAQLVRTAAGLRPGPLTTPAAAAKLALRELARRAQRLSAEIQRLDAELARLARTAAPGLLARRGVGADVAGALLVVAGDNPSGSGARLPSRCCVAPRRCRRPRAAPSATA